MSLERRIEIRPAYHLPADHPKAPGTRHGADMIFSIGNERGWITWVLFTGWELPSSRHTACIQQYPWEFWRAPTPAGCAYHSPVKPNDWAFESDCNLFGHCWSDSTCLTEDLFELLIAQGTDGLWAELERRWQRQFGDTR